MRRGGGVYVGEGAARGRGFSAPGREGNASRRGGGPPSRRTCSRSMSLITSCSFSSGTMSTACMAGVGTDAVRVGECEVHPWPRHDCITFVNASPPGPLPHPHPLARTCPLRMTATSMFLEPESTTSSKARMVRRTASSSEACQWVQPRSAWV